MWKKLICVLAIAALLCGAVTAASGARTVEARLRPDVTVVIDGTARTFYNVQGQEVHPIGYAGTTYVPIRAIGELMDRNVNWDETTHTATIAGARTTPDATGTPDTAARAGDITVSLRPDYTIIIDGTARTFRDANGQTVSPLLYNGSIYLPIRAIGEIMGKTVSWNGNTDTVTLTGDTDPVTDFDTNHPSGGTGSTGTSVTLESAKATALEDAGVTASQATFVRAQLDWDDGRQVYDVEFVVASGNTYLEYDYEIDAATGRILSVDRDAEYYRPTTGGTGATITEEQARQIALAKVPGATASDIRLHLDRDDGRYEYEGSIFYNYMEYEFTIDATTGNIVDWEVESIYD